MNQSRSKINKQQMQWRRTQVLQLAGDGHTEREIASKLQKSQPTIARDIMILRKQSQEQIHRYIDERVPFEYSKTLAGLEGIIKSMSDIISSSRDNKEIMNASAIKMQAYDMKMELVSNASLVQEAIDLSQKHRGLTPQNGKVLKDGSAKYT
jgi:IS30 family transposase